MGNEKQTKVFNTQNLMKSDHYWLRKFGIKNCLIKLDRIKVEGIHVFWKM